ncbi:MAG: dephospho-CoA kinase [Desulfobacterales bacterium]
MIVAGLTGGIASGKSTVAAILESAGAIIIDADEIAREVVRKGQPAWHEIVQHFGRNILLTGGEINRSLLGDIIFKNPEKKELLNRIVHPRVKKETDQRLRQVEKNTPNAVVILDVPLLFEAGMFGGLSEVIVVYAPEPIQLLRLIRRDNLSESDAMARIRSQMPIEKKKNLASIVIDNSGTRALTRKATLSVYRKLKKRAGSHRSSCGPA